MALGIKKMGVDINDHKLRTLVFSGHITSWLCPSRPPNKPVRCVSRSIDLRCRP
jgi:hypothetical protein